MVDQNSKQFGINNETHSNHLKTLVMRSEESIALQRRRNKEEGIAEGRKMNGMEGTLKEEAAVKKKRDGLQAKKRRMVRRSSIRRRGERMRIIAIFFVLSLSLFPQTHTHSLQIASLSLSDNLTLKWSKVELPLPHTVWFFFFFSFRNYIKILVLIPSYYKKKIIQLLIIN